MKLLAALILFLASPVHSMAEPDTLHVYFETDIPFLNAAAEKHLEKDWGKLDRQKDLLIIGYADERGDDYYNDMLSMRRAQNVADFLERKGILREKMKLVYGKGAVRRVYNDPTLYTSDRRVDIVPAGEGHLATVRVADTTGMPELKQNLASLPVGRTLVLNNINFFMSSAMYTPSSKPTLYDLLNAMKSYPSLHIQLEGHVCCMNNDDPVTRKGGLKLSLQRADILRNYLVNNGIESSRITTKGFGRDRPLVVERTSVDRGINRRVEVRIISR